MKNEYDYLNDVKMDFSLYEDEYMTDKEVKSVLKNVRENNDMTKRVVQKKRLFTVVCAAAIVMTCTVFASGSEIINKIVKTITTGHNYFIQMEGGSYDIPDELKGKLFDKNGDPIDVFSEESYENIYDAEGNKIDNTKLAQMYTDSLGEQVAVNKQYNEEEAEKSYNTIEEAQDSAVFNIKVPEYIPDGFEFSRAYAYADTNGDISGEYMTLEYKNKKGHNIRVFERILNEETAFTSSTDGTIEETEVNGRKAVIVNEESIYWETENNVSVGISAKGKITKDEMIKMAESVK